MTTSSQRHVTLNDPSELYRPEPQYEEYNIFYNLKAEIPKGLGKEKEQFRTFNKENATLWETYENMHTKQTVSLGKEMREKWLKFNHAKMTIMDAVMGLDNFVDKSDPDIDLANSLHAFQTAERIREEHPDQDWFHLVGLIHDLGKIMALNGEPQYLVVGDTFPVGCKFSDKIVFSEQFEGNPDSQNTDYNTKYGIYEPNCGLDNILMSWGHDEYMYQVLIANGCKIPKQGLYMIRYHSFYSWHCEKDYDYLCNDVDREMVKWVNKFNRFDLYSKADTLPEVEKIKPYYQSLVDKYCPGVLKW